MKKLGILILFCTPLLGMERVEIAPQTTYEEPEFSMQTALEDSIKNHAVHEVENLLNQLRESQHSDLEEGTPLVRKSANLDAIQELLDVKKKGLA